MTALEDAARRYAAAVVAHHSSNGRTALECLLEREASEHELLVLAGFPCPYCEGDSCPGPSTRRISDTLPLEEWQDARDRDREEAHRLITGDIDRT